MRQHWSGLRRCATAWGVPGSAGGWRCPTPAGVGRGWRFFCSAAAACSLWAQPQAAARRTACHASDSNHTCWHAEGRATCHTAEHTPCVVLILLCGPMCGQRQRCVVCVLACDVCGQNPSSSPGCRVRVGDGLRVVVGHVLVIPSAHCGCAIWFPTCMVDQACTLAWGAGLPGGCMVHGDACTCASCIQQEQARVHGGPGFWHRRS
jgi:hypothetical protein